MKIQQITSWQGEIGRKDYLLWGIILFAFKYNLDRLTAWLFGKGWFIVDYMVQVDNLAVNELADNDQIFYAVLILQSLPFIWVGTILTVKRLRHAGIPSGLVLFFFLPFINFFLFILLSIIPAKDPNAAHNLDGAPKPLINSKFGSALVALGIVITVTLAISYFLINQLKEYGWSLFVGIPFFLGFGSVLLYGYNRLITYREALAVMFASIIFFNLSVFILAFEGIICLTMAFPLFLFLGWIGASIGYAIHQSTQQVIVSAFSLPLFCILAYGGLEFNASSKPPLSAVSTEVVVNASKQAIWDELVAFSEIDPPTDWLFATGIAYPTHAGINGVGVGAVRRCNFTTGTFVEPITIWDEPNLLAFSVLDQPPLMLEWSIYQDLAIEHLDGYFKSERGEFRLEELPNGSIKLTGTTWYRHDIWPTFYWGIYSNYILHKIHFRVLNHIKEKAEQPS